MPRATILRARGLMATMQPNAFSSATQPRRLSKCKRRLSKEGLSLKVFDCYRPERAVKAFLDWAKRPDEPASQKRFYPNLGKGELVQRGYIAARSSHSRGVAVDLTLARLPAAPQRSLRPHEPYGACTGPAESRAPDNGLDMGTSFDCFDEASWLTATNLSPTQIHWRKHLKKVMAQFGFASYAKEWWHFTFTRAKAGPAIDVPIRSPGVPNGRR